MKKITASIALFLLSIISYSQSTMRVGDWGEYLNYRKPISVTIGNGRVYCATTGGFFWAPTNENSIHHLSKLNGLADIEATIVKYNSYNQKTLIVYKNTNMDIIEPGNTIMNIPDIKNLHFLYLATTDYLPFDVNFGLHLENQYFVNILVDDGRGQETVENTFGWFQVGIERVFGIWHFLIIPQISVAKNVFSSTTIGNEVKLDAMKTEAGIEIGWKENYRMGIKYARDTVTATNLNNFKTDQKSIFFSLSYVFNKG